MIQPPEGGGVARRMAPARVNPRVARAHLNPKLVLVPPLQLLLLLRQQQLLLLLLLRLLLIVELLPVIRVNPNPE